MCPEDGAFILSTERFRATVPFLCVFVWLFEIFFSNLPRPGIFLCFPVFPLHIDYMFPVASAVNFNYDVRLQGSLAKQPASLAVQTHVYGTDGGLQSVSGDTDARQRK